MYNQNYIYIPVYSTYVHDKYMIFFSHYRHSMYIHRISNVYWVIKDEVITVLTELGECLASDVRVGPFRQMRGGLNMTWVQCPLSAAFKISKKGKINLGWSVARVELMKAKPIKCFKCWHFGHVRNNCESSTDRTGHCFRCGDSNHNSDTCTADPKCVICADLGYEFSHRLGSTVCSAMIRVPGRTRNK